MSLNPWKDIGGLPRSLWVLSGVSLINRLGTMALPFLVLYLTRSRGFTPGRAGIVMAVYGAASLVASPLSGWLSDRFGAFRVLNLSFVLGGLSLLIYPLAQSFGWILAATVLWSMTGEMSRPATLSATTLLAPAELRRPAFALLRLSINLGMSVGPAVGGYLAHIWFPLIFLVNGGCTLLAGLVLFAVRWGQSAEARAEHAPVAIDPSASVTPLWRDRRLLLAMAVSFLIAAIFFQLSGPLPLFVVHDLGLDEVHFGRIYLVNTLLIILLEVWLNARMAHWAHNRALALGSLLLALGFAANGLATGFVTLALTTVIWTFGEMIIFPGMSAYYAEIAPAGRSGAYMGMYTLSFGLAFVAGPWGGTLVYEHWGAGVVWSLVGLVGIIAAGLALALRSTDQVLAPATAESPNP